MKSVLQVCLAALNAAALIIWRAVRPALSLVLQILAALILIFEEWGWRPLSQALAWLARFRPWAQLELAVAGLPPYAALAAIALPTTLLFPLKFVAIWLVANGHLVTAAALFIAAKIVSTALIARIFILVKPALMQIGWFAAIYERFVPWKEAVFAKIRATWAWRYGRMLKNAARIETKQAWARWRPGLAGAVTRMRSSLRGQWLKIRPRLQLEWMRVRLNVRRLWTRIAS